MLNDYTDAQLLESGLGEELLRNQEEYRRMISQSIRTCCSGNRGARETVKELIRVYLIREIGLNEQNIQEILPFAQEEKLTAMQQMEILIYQNGEETGFFHLWNQSGWGMEKKDRIVTEEEVRRLYALYSKKLSFRDQIAVLAHLLYADTVGLGAIDTLNWQLGCIEEIQLGMNGFAEKNYNYREEMQKKEIGKAFHRDGVHVLIQGETVWLKYLSFGTEEELQRVLKNLIKDAQVGELTRNHPMIVIDTVDGRRVSVSRPPMTDVWAGLIRKFDSVKEVSLGQLYCSEKGGEYLTSLLKYIVQSGRNIAITGEMASGKTTLFRACLKETKPERNLRVIEAESFELNVRSFLPEKNSLTMRISDTTPVSEVLAFARKTTGQIFAVGEVNSASVAVMTMDLSKIATQLFFSAHYITTEHMISDFINAKLCVGGYTEEAMAEIDVVRGLGFDIHLQNRNGRRYVRYINEIVPVAKGNGKAYQVRCIYQYDEEKECGCLLEIPSEYTFERAKEELDYEEFQNFLEFFRKEKLRDGTEKEAFS